MKIYGSKLPFPIPARTFVVDGSVGDPVQPIVAALEKSKFRLVTAPGQLPVRMQYGSFLKDAMSFEDYTWVLPEKFQRWSWDVNVYVDSGRDAHGNHAVTVTSHGYPSRSNDHAFGVVDQAIAFYAQSSQLLHVSDYFQGDPKALKARIKKQRQDS